jgi:hypothetical protein
MEDALRTEGETNAASSAESRRLPSKTTHTNGKKSLFTAISVLHHSVEGGDGSFYLGRASGSNAMRTDECSDGKPVAETKGSQQFLANPRSAVSQM